MRVCTCRPGDPEGWYREDCAIHGDCEHDWMKFGGPGDEWRECFLCGRQEDS